MPSIPAIIKIIASLAAVAQPQISKIINDKKENHELKLENDRLKRENDFLKKQRVFFIIVSVLLCAALIAALVILSSKEIVYG